MTALPRPSAPAPTLRNLPAPAKINLFLHVVGQRPDGYHLLQSAFALLHWHDLIHLHLRPDGVVQHRRPVPGLPPDDLCVRAARALQQATGCRLGADIELEKTLPTQAGLGGGSSNAATCLMGLNHLWQLGLKGSELQAIGAGLGADVPFFLCGQAAWVEGIGERLTPLVVPEQPVVVVKPRGGLATGDVFGHPDLERATPSATMRDFVASVSKGLTAFGRNDLQGIAQQLCPEVGHVLHWLRRQGLSGRMSGSGSAVFASLPAGCVLGDPPADWLVHVTRVVTSHPLAGWID